MIVHLMLLLVQWLPPVLVVLLVSVDLTRNVHSLLPAVMTVHSQSTTHNAISPLTSSLLWHSVD